MWPGTVRQPYARVNFITPIGDYEFGYRLQKLVGIVYRYCSMFKTSVCRIKEMSQDITLTTELRWQETFYSLNSSKPPRMKGPLLYICDTTAYRSVVCYRLVYRAAAFVAELDKEQNSNKQNKKLEKYLSSLLHILASLKKYNKAPSSLSYFIEKT
jgi:hypothetical protein